MRYFIASSTIPDDALSALRSLGYREILLPPYQRLQAGVSSHADMLLYICGKSYICTEEYYKCAKSTLQTLNSLGYEPIISKEIHTPEYPGDILFNCFRLGDKIYGLERAMSEHIKRYAEQNNITIRNVRQGYAKCSTLVVDDRSVITADTSIAKAVRTDSYNVLQIKADGVFLEGYDKGFIGGCAGVDGNKIFFCGNLSLHPDGEEIKKFCRERQKECISLSNDVLFDVGSLFFI